ncbi:hypothetical protein ACWF9B_00065 [Streptomyces sp. NPDC055089]
MDIAVLNALCDLAEDQDAPKLQLYLDDQDLLDPWEHPDQAFTDCVRTVEAGAQRRLTPA